jgi:vancomycin resistance protein VanJ
MSESVRSPTTGASWLCHYCEAQNAPETSRTRCRECGTDRDPGEAKEQRGLDSGREIQPESGKVPGGGSPRFDPRAWIGLASEVTTWTWAILVLLDLLLIRWVGDRWWGVAFLLFFPRWLFLAPLPILAIAGGVARRPRQWVLQGVVVLVIAGPLMRLSLPFQQLWDRPVAGFRLRVMTFNRGPARIAGERLIRLIELERIDLLCFQEGMTIPSPRLEAYLKSGGWYRDRRRLLASRYPIVEEWPPLAGDSRSKHRYPVSLVRVRIRAAPGVEFGLATVHMPTLRFGFYRFLDHDLEGLEQHLDWWDHEMRRVMDGLSAMREVPVLIGGDFNVPPDHATMAALFETFRFAFEDAGWGYGYTRPSRYPWFRIDHILASPEWVFTRCRVGPDLGSDHLPLIAEAVLPTASRALRDEMRRSPGHEE